MVTMAKKIYERPRGATIKYRGISQAPKRRNRNHIITSKRYQKNQLTSPPEVTGPQQDQAEHPALHNYAILENECVLTKILRSRHDLILEY